MTQIREYRTLGRSGLRVSPVGLGVMTYGWGAEKQAARAMFDLYRERGGNFVDTADGYGGGESERWLGEFVRDSGSRDGLVIATKFSFNVEAGNPNAGGNGRKNILRAVDGSLRRLQTDYIDLYYLHAWDRVTPVAEVMRTLDDLVRAGKIRHIGLSDVPAWYAARAQEMGISLIPWSPLASGFLTGKYRRENGRITGAGRVMDQKDSDNPVLSKFARRERYWDVLDELLTSADELGRTPTELALAWVMHRPQVTSVLVGATKRQQLELNLGALDLTVPDRTMRRLDDIGRPESTELDHFFEPTMQAMLTGGVEVRRGVG